MMQTSHPHMHERADLGGLTTVTEKPNPLLIHVHKVHSILKSQLVNILNGNNVDIDAAILKELQTVHDQGYSEGMKHMDLMHHKLDSNTK